MSPDGLAEASLLERANTVAKFHVKLPMCSSRAGAANTIRFAPFVSSENIKLARSVRYASSNAFGAP